MFEDCRCPSSSIMEWLNVPRQPCFPRLSKFSLFNVESSQDDLLKFLSLHSKSLRNLLLEQILLNEGQWVPIIKALGENFKLEAVLLDALDAFEPESRWSHVDDVDINDLPPGNLMERVERYIIKGGECPLPTEDEAEDAQAEWIRLSDKSFTYELFKDEDSFTDDDDDAENDSDNDDGDKSQAEDGNSSHIDDE